MPSFFMPICYTAGYKFQIENCKHTNFFQDNNSDFRQTERVINDRFFKIWFHLRLIVLT